MAAPIKVLVAVLLVLFLLCGILDVLLNFEDNQCEMTWMYERPEYHRIEVNKKVQTMFPRYGLYFYGEGSYVREMKKLRYKLTGIPVLFIPGNGGSYKQVRSLGSVAQRKAEKMNSYFHFNYFAVDLDEELSGLYGNALYQQTEYVQHCIRKILYLYKTSENPPKSVVIVGHSMGGMIARALFTLPNFDHTTVSTIITQATPHQGIVLMYDYNVAKFYKEVNSYWRKYKNGKLKDVTVISTAGGFRDFQIRHDLCSLDGLVENNVSISTSSMSVPKAWASTDHLCSVWCRQMVLVTERSLFDIVNRTTRQVSTSTQNKMNVFHYHFIENQGSREYLPVWEEKPEIIRGGVWEEIPSKHWHIVNEARKKFVYLTVPVRQDAVLVAVSNAKIDDWVFACKKTTGKQGCKDTLNLSSKGRSIPPLYSNKRIVHLEMGSLKEFTDIVFVMPRGDDKEIVSGEILSQGDLYSTLRLPGILDILSTFPSSLLARKEMTRFTGGNSVYRVMRLDGLYGVFHTYSVLLESERCTNVTDEYVGSVMQFHVPGSNEDTYKFIKQGFSGVLTLKRQTFPRGKSKHLKPELRLYLQPGCEYKLYVKFEIFDFMGQFFRFYGPLLSAFIVANILMAFIGQLRSLGKYSLCPTFLEALTNSSRPYFILPVVEGLRYLMSLPFFSRFMTFYGFPEDDSFVLRRFGLWFPPLSLILYIIALGVVAYHGYMLETFFSIAGWVLRKVFCCSSSCSRLLTFFKYTVLLIAIVVSATVCGTLGIVICYGVQFLKLLRLSYIRDPASKNNFSTSMFNFHFSIFLLLMWLLMFEAVPGLVWARQISLSYRLEGDPSRLISVLVTVAYLVISKWDKPAPVSGIYTSVCFMIYIQTVLLILYAVYSQYRIAYVIVAAVLSLIVPQVVSNKVYNLDKLEQKEKHE